MAGLLLATLNTVPTLGTSVVIAAWLHGRTGPRRSTRRCLPWALPRSRSWGVQDQGRSGRRGPRRRVRRRRARHEAMGCMRYRCAGHRGGRPRLGPQRGADRVSRANARQRARPRRVERGHARVARREAQGARLSVTYGVYRAIRLAPEGFGDRTCRNLASVLAASRPGKTELGAQAPEKLRLSSGTVDAA